MTDQSAQHGHRIDDEMSSDVEGLVRGSPIGTRAREDLDPEAVQTTTPVFDLIDDERHDVVLQRSELARFLRPSALPADASAILAIAREEAATEPVLDELERLPQGIEFATVSAIWEALGHETEHRDSVRPATQDDNVEVAADQARTSVDTTTDVGNDHIDQDAEREPHLTAEARPAPVEPGTTYPPAGEAKSLRAWSVLTVGVGLVRGVLGVADRTLAALQDRLER
jgi:hypothetical protein